jgi:hypothetical protein
MFKQKHLKSIQGILVVNLATVFDFQRPKTKFQKKIPKTKTRPNLNWNYITFSTRRMHLITTIEAEPNGWNTYKHITAFLVSRSCTRTRPALPKIMLS